MQAVQVEEARTDTLASTDGLNSGTGPVVDADRTGFSSGSCLRASSGSAAAWCGST